MAYPCPQCSDRSTQRISLMYDSSTRRWRDHAGRARSSQSDLASKYSPPQPRGYLARVLGVIVLSIVGSSVGRVVGYTIHMPLLAVALGWTALGVSAYWLIGGARRYNAKVWRPAMQQWESLFICLGCGHTFVPVYSPAPAIHGDHVHV